jgi:hypothetical protein
MVPLPSVVKTLVAKFVTAVQGELQVIVHERVIDLQRWDDDPMRPETELAEELLSQRSTRTGKA